MSRIVSSAVAVAVLENPGKMRIISSFLKVRLLVKLKMNIILINFTDKAVMFFSVEGGGGKVTLSLKVRPF